ncbi:unnamed protein product [Vitrella brassicaformis CCMP3155]|uniref:Uncharacterized protein n=1 Tax=Vitrella brassicaformis (strain CCMP3155) TaxID=1169540 RepID=A0A0G4EIU9_VITBC|nr:unnamed protein product [Vitrella brassicaformis CCMP3155]|eukprot:CEL96940.1 unnamed protein product [Vitrella brassicaformis CCMP3155]
MSHAPSRFVDVLRDIGAGDQSAPSRTRSHTDRDTEVRFVDDPLNPHGIAAHNQGRFKACFYTTEGIVRVIRNGNMKYIMVKNDQTDGIRHLSEKDAFLTLGHPDSHIRGVTVKTLLVVGTALKLLCDKHNSQPHRSILNDIAAAKPFVSNPNLRSTNPQKVADAIAALPRLLEDYHQTNTHRGRKRTAPSSAAAAAASAVDTHMPTADDTQPTNDEDINDSGSIIEIDIDAAIPNRALVNMSALTSRAALARRIRDLPDTFDIYKGDVDKPTGITIMMSSEECDIDTVFDNEDDMGEAWGHARRLVRAVESLGASMADMV